MTIFWAAVIAIIAVCTIVSLVIWIIAFCGAADINPLRFLEKIADHAEETAGRFNERRKDDGTES